MSQRPLRTRLLALGLWTGATVFSTVTMPVTWAVVGASILRGRKPEPEPEPVMSMTMEAEVDRDVWDVLMGPRKYSHAPGYDELSGPGSFDQS